MNQQLETKTIRELIAQLGISQREAARQLDVHDRTVRYWCADTGQQPRIAVLALEHLIYLKENTMTTIQTVMKLVDELGDPRRMSKQQWIDFLEEISSEYESRSEAAREEMRRAENE